MMHNFRLVFCNDLQFQYWPLRTDRRRDNAGDNMCSLRASTTINHVYIMRGATPHHLRILKLDTSELSYGDWQERLPWGPA